MLLLCREYYCMPSPVALKSVDRCFCRSLKQCVGCCCAEYSTACQALHQQRMQIFRALDKDFDQLTHRATAREQLVNYYNQIASPPVSTLLHSNSRVCAKLTHTTNPHPDPVGRIIFYQETVLPCKPSIAASTLQQYNSRTRTMHAPPTPFPKRLRNFFKRAGASGCKILLEGCFKICASTQGQVREARAL